MVEYVHMDNDTHTKRLKLSIVLIMIAVLIIGAVLYLLYAKMTSVEKSLTSLQESYDIFTLDTGQLDKEQERKLVELSDILYQSQNDIAQISDDIYDYNRTVGRLSGTVETLEKISTTDPELLQKYSKVYFLNEHYMPADLTRVDEKYAYDNGKDITINSKVWPFLEELLEEAREDGLDLMVLSGYRSFEEQQTLKDTYTVQYGSGANTFSADQGYSEHQLGTTVDFTTPEIGSNLDLFEQTNALAWLNKHAYKYGFVMSYPENNQYYQYEPWHWRFVGEDLARDLHKNEAHFYDMEQREIDTYIPELFD
jgi:D-alanyl-D-alanine carboxypeptidase